MNIVVQKFGGTSLANDENREKVVEKIIEKYNKNYNIIVVVSAIGRAGNPYATDSLLDLVDKTFLDNREIDLLLSCGETISAVVLSNLLNKKGLKSKVFTGYQAGITTDENFGDAGITKIEPTKLIETLNKNEIAIITGFQGMTIDGEITTLGRGGSDISAIALGKALDCESVEIYTDVDGVMTADPNIVPTAKVLETMCYSEVYQLAEDGAKVIHPKAVEIAQQYNVPVKIKNTFSNSSGTTIEEPNINYYNNRKELYGNKIITAITYKKGRVQVNIKTDTEDHTEKLMEKVTEYNISIDLINFFLDKKVFTIDKKDLTKLVKILDSEDYEYEIVEDCCKLSAIGYKMQGLPGVMARIVSALSKENIKILQSSDSHNTIWCLVREKDLNKAIKVLHKVFELDK
ncbi:MAG TPA: aspartate kinase [Tissierellales bacterium]|nr:aspartate kinase [Tissierellales bacterium]